MFSGGGGRLKTNASKSKISIALALVVIAGEKIITDAHAQNRPAKVVICDAYGSKCAGIDGYNENGALYIRSK